MGTTRNRIEIVALSGAVIGLLFSVVFAVFSTLGAVDERRTAAAAMDLSMAVTAVASADQIQALGGEVRRDELERSVEALSTDRETALKPLSPVERRDAERMLDEITGCGLLLLEPDAVHHPPHEHAQLQELLGEATQRSSGEARQAEKNAAIALTAMALVSAFAVGLVMWSRSKAAQIKSASTAHLRAGQRLEALLNDSPDILLVIGPDDRISYRSASSSQLLGGDANSSQDLAGLAHTQHQEAIRSHIARADTNGASALFELRQSDLSSGWFDIRVSDLTEHELVGGRLLTIRDVSNEVRLRAELQRQANTDLLTGVANRRVLQPVLEAARAALLVQSRTMAVLSIDIDGFKSINDGLGHLAGDQLLVEVAARLKAGIRSGETLIRLGGDEFAVIMPSVTDVATVELAANRLLGVLDEPFLLGQRTEHVRASVGVAVASNPRAAKSLIAQADVALYEAKRKGGGRAVVYEESLNETSTRRDQINRALREADFDQELSLVFQPIVAAANGRISTLEALVRWTSPSLGVVNPDEFIPVAEVTGEICRLGKWVFEGVCRQLAEWNAAGMDPNISVSFNVSPRELGEDAFVQCVLETARKWGASPQQLVVEVTESAALDHTGRAQQKLEQLRAAGLRISIDDFGSGYSNLGQLLAVPFDVIKIDRSLLLTLSGMREQAGGDPTDPCTIMEAIVSIASILNAPVVCEGVETEEQLVSLRASGITHIQGYLTGRPMPPESLSWPERPTPNREAHAVG